VEDPWNLTWSDETVSNVGKVVWMDVGVVGTRAVEGNITVSMTSCLVMVTPIEIVPTPPIVPHLTNTDAPGPQAVITICFLHPRFNNK